MLRWWQVIHDTCCLWNFCNKQPKEHPKSNKQYTVVLYTVSLCCAMLANSFLPAKRMDWTYLDGEIPMWKISRTNATRILRTAVSQRRGPRTGRRVGNLVSLVDSLSSWTTKYCISSSNDTCLLVLFCGKAEVLPTSCFPRTIQSMRSTTTTSMG